MRPKLYYRVEENGVPFDNFCSDAAIGASERGVECITFTDINKVDKNPYNIVVTSVEESLEWLDQNIQAIDDKWATEFKKRKEVITTIDEIIENIKWVYHSELGYFPIIISKRKLTVYKQGLFYLDELTDVNTDHYSVEGISNIIKSHLDWVYQTHLNDLKDSEVINKMKLKNGMVS